MQLSRIIAHVALAAAIAASAVSPTDAASGWMAPSRNTNDVATHSVAETTQRKLGEGGGFGATIQIEGNAEQNIYDQNNQGAYKPDEQEVPATQSVNAQNGQGGNTGEEKEKKEQQEKEKKEQQEKEKKEQHEKEKKEQQEKEKKEQQEKEKKEQQEKAKKEQQEKEKTEQQEKVNVSDQNVQPGKGIPLLLTWDDLEQSLKH